MFAATINAAQQAMASGLNLQALAAGQRLPERNKVFLSRMLDEVVETMARDVPGLSTANASISGLDLLRLCQMAAKGL